MSSTQCPQFLRTDLEWGTLQHLFCPNAACSDCKMLARSSAAWNAFWNCNELSQKHHKPGKQAPSGEVAGGQHWWCLHCSHTPKCFVMRGRWMLFHWGSPGANGAATSMPWETTFSVVTSPNLPLMHLLLSRRVVNVSRPDCSVLACRLAFGVLIATNATSFARGASMPKLSPIRSVISEAKGSWTPPI